MRMGRHLGRGIISHSQFKQRTGVVKCNPLQHDRVQLGVAFPGKALQLVAHGSAGDRCAGRRLPLWNLHSVRQQLRALFTGLCSSVQVHSRTQCLLIRETLELCPCSTDAKLRSIGHCGLMEGSFHGFNLANVHLKPSVASGQRIGT